MANPKPRPYIQQPADPSIRYIALTKGQKVTVDADRYEWAIQWNWYAEFWKTTGTFYAARRGRGSETHSVYLHRELIKATSPHVDHWNGDSLDCRVTNLRECTESQNHMNHGLQKNNTSGHSGVSWSKKTGQWRSRITVNRKEIFLGLFDEIEDAISSRRMAEDKYFGEFRYSSRH